MSTSDRPSHPQITLLTLASKPSRRPPLNLRRRSGWISLAAVISQDLTSVDRSVFLLVDDSPDDLLLLKRAFTTVAVDDAIVAVERGQDAIDYLTAAVEPGDRRPLPVPVAILTDLKMPGMEATSVF